MVGVLFHDVFDFFQSAAIDAVIMSLQVRGLSLDDESFGNELVQRVFDNCQARLGFLVGQPPFSNSHESILSIRMLEQVIKNRSRDLSSSLLGHCI